MFDNIEIYKEWATMNHHPSMHHPLDACYYLAMDEFQLS
jgi:hypothetical protein